MQRRERHNSRGGSSFSCFNYRQVVKVGAVLVCAGDHVLDALCAKPCLRTYQFLPKQASEQLLGPHQTLIHSSPLPRLSDQPSRSSCQSRDVENDESWYPMSESLYETLSVFPRLGRMQFPFPFYAYPFYLWCRTPGKSGTHYSPSRDLFNASEWKEVLTTTASWLVMVAILAAAVSHMGFLWTLKVYFVPYVVNIVDLLRHIPPPSRIREENSLVPRPGMELHSRRVVHH